MRETMHAKTKSGKEIVIYPFNGKIKFCPVEKFNAYCVNYFDPSFNGTIDECVRFIESQP